MKDPWKYMGFPVAAVAGYMVNRSVVSGLISGSTNIYTVFWEASVVAAVGFIAGFTVDQLIPAYLDKVKNREGADDFGGGGFDDEDLDFE